MNKKAYYGETEGYGPNIPVAITTAFGQSKPQGILPVDIFGIDSEGNFTDEIVYPIGSGLGDFIHESLDQIETEAYNGFGL